MRIHELLDQPLTEYIQQLTDEFKLGEVSWYRYKTTANPQLKRAMQVARKTTSRIKKTDGKAKSIAKRAGHSATKAAAANAIKQKAALKQSSTPNRWSCLENCQLHKLNQPFSSQNLHPPRHP